MDLEQHTRCIFITWAILIIICQTKCESRNASTSTSPKLALNTPTFAGLYHSHRVLIVTSLGTVLLMLLGCLGCLCCCCCWCRCPWQSTVDNLDAYAPRTQSIVWPSVPADTARVVEVTFLHMPGAVDCLCNVCHKSKNILKLENCTDTTDC